MLKLQDKSSDRQGIQRDERGGRLIDRRTVLLGAAGAAVAGATGSMSASGEVAGIMPEGVRGALQGPVGVSGAQRLPPAGTAWLDISNPRNPERIDAGMPLRGTVSFQESTRKWIYLRTYGQPLSNAEPGSPFV